MAITNDQFKNVVKEQTGKATFLTPIFLAQFGSTFDADPNTASLLSADDGEKIVAAANDGVFWQGSYEDGQRMVKQKGVWVVDGAALAEEKAASAKIEAIAEAQVRIDAAKLGRAYKGEIDSASETLATAGVPSLGISVLVWQDGVSNGSYEGDGTSWTRVADAAAGMIADGALWYVRSTKELWAVEGDGVVFGDSIAIGRASAPLDVSGEGAIEVINGRIRIDQAALEHGGFDQLDGENIKVAYQGPLLGVNDGPLVAILQKIERNQRREDRPLAFTVTKAQLEASLLGSALAVLTEPISDGFTYDSARAIKAMFFGGGQLKPTEFSITQVAQAVTITFVAELVDQLREYPENYDGELLLPIIPVS